MEQCGSAVTACRGCATRYKEAIAKVGSSACWHLRPWWSVVTVLLWAIPGELGLKHFRCKWHQGAVALQWGQLLGSLCRPGLCCFGHHSRLPVDVLLVMLQWIFFKNSIIVIWKKTQIIWLNSNRKSCICFSLKTNRKSQTKQKKPTQPQTFPYCMTWCVLQHLSCNWFCIRAADKNVCCIGVSRQ